MKTIRTSGLKKISKIYARSKVEWDSISGTKSGIVKQIFSSHANVIDENGNSYIILVSKLRKK